MFTQKQIIFIADVLKDCDPKIHEGQKPFSTYYGEKLSHNLIIRELTKLFKGDNHKFNEKKFQRACYREPDRQCKGSY